MSTLVNEQEVLELARQYGQPVRRQVELEIGVELFLTRFLRSGDRRGEVVLALQRANGRLLLHRKAHYGEDTYRLLSGGVGLSEAVADAAVREAQEETGLHVALERFLAVIEYALVFGAIRLPFVSYVWLLRECGGELRVDSAEVAALRACWPAELPAVAAQLRSIPGERGYWGRWRAVAHEVVSVILNEPGHG